MELEPSAEQLLCEMELSLFENGKYSPEEFLTIMNKKIEENCPSAYKCRAYGYYLVAMYNEAIEDYKKALEINPSDEEIIAALNELEQM